MCTAATVWPPNPPPFHSQEWQAAGTAAKRDLNIFFPPLIQKTSCFIEMVHFVGDAYWGGGRRSIGAGQEEVIVPKSCPCFEKPAVFHMKNVLYLHKVCKSFPIRPLLWTSIWETHHIPRASSLGAFPNFLMAQFCPFQAVWSMSLPVCHQCVTSWMALPVPWGGKRDEPPQHPAPSTASPQLMEQMRDAGSYIKM